MIHHIKGNLLTSDCKVIIHQSNCQMGFGSGIAGQIRQQRPNAYEAFKNDKRTPMEKLGGFSVGIDDGKVTYNMYSQFKYGMESGVVYTDYSAFRYGLKLILDEIKQSYGVDVKIGLPYLIGCGLARGDWNIIKGIIEEASNEYGVDLYLYEFTPAQ